LRIQAQSAAIALHIVESSIGILNTHVSHKHGAESGALGSVFRLTDGDSAGEVDEAKSEDESEEDLGHLERG